MTHTLVCTIPTKPIRYEIEIGSSILHDAGKFTPFGKHFAIICDENSKETFGITLLQTLIDAGCTAAIFSFAPGEQSKSRKTKETIEDQMFQAGFGRDACVIGLGGGVVLDMTGFIASTFCRGVTLVHMPTTLLAMADASIGGKNGVDIPHGKNLIGTFYQPAKIMIDTDCLKSLPLREQKNGLVEMIKHGLIKDSDYFEFLEKEGLGVMQSPHIAQAITRSCAIKLEVVESDEKENGKRRLLNFGHTIGHAIENVAKYSLAHGEAVAIGCVAEGYLAYKMGMLQKDAFERIYEIFHQFALPFTLPKECTQNALIDAMGFDKKALEQTPRFVIIDAIGSAATFQGNYCTQVEKALLQTTLTWMINDLCRN